MKWNRYIWLIPAFSVLMGGCGSLPKFQVRALYDADVASEQDEINGFNALAIFQDNVDNSIWVSPEKHCIQLQRVTNTQAAGTASLRITWNKIEGGCTWLGTGFGWNNWLPKDMFNITQSAAVQLKVKSVKGSFSNWPVAFAFEDYQGTQIYAGFDKKMAQGVFTDSTWNTVTIPLNEFRFDRADFNSEQ
ncbi:MAG: hypothetical protein FGM54_08115, partial [Chitinophagaceae bacterium]|nr:hypothetical protein [Chitinophagaceae bacterium]